MRVCVCVCVFFLFFMTAQPPTVACKNGSSVGTRTRCTHVFSHVPRRLCMLSRCLVTRISASELSRKFIKSALSVGWRLLSPAPSFFFSQGRRRSFINSSSLFSSQLGWLSHVYISSPSDSSSSRLHAGRVGSGSARTHHYLKS